MATSVCGKSVTIIKEAARKLGFKRDTVRDLIKANKIKTYRVVYSPAARGIDAAGMAILRQCAGKGVDAKQNGVKV